MNISFVMMAHALVGLAVVCSGAMALVLNKGSLPHKIAGRLFVCSMLLMAPVVTAGAWLAPGSISSLGILFIFFIVYLVVSGWSSISQSRARLTRVNIAAPLVALCISIAGLIMGFNAVSNPSEVDLPPKEAYFFFATLAFVAMLLDVNNLRLGGIRGKHRIVRHVWRMSCALFFATSTLFTGPGSIVLPEWVRGNPALSIPEFLVVIVALLWIYRLLRSKRRILPETITAAIESQISTKPRTES